MTASIDHLKDDFYVVAVLSNPERYKTRVRLFQEFLSRMRCAGVKVCVVEIAYGDRDFEIADLTNPLHIQLRSDSEIWHKENMVNIGISRLPVSWKYVAWIDGDVHFVRPDWIEETIHELQHHPVVQMFEDSIDLGPDYQILQTYKGFAYCYKKGVPMKGDIKGQAPYYYSTTRGLYWHPGYAWAATRDAINTLGGLFELGICGAGDHHMACSLIGQASRSIPKGISVQYKKEVEHWAERAARLHKNIGYIKGTLYHFWHGKKRDRRYKDRWSILIENKYDPVRHVHRDWHGVLTLYEGHDKLRDELRMYFQSRNEDSIDLE